MSIAEVRQLPFAEKLQIMEAIWEDLRAQVEQVPVPQWHRDLLDERRKAVEAGREPLLDWDAIKDSAPPVLPSKLMHKRPKTAKNHPLTLATESW